MNVKTYEGPVTQPEVVERVQAGAAWLDQTMPGWVDLLDPDQLDMAHECFCVLGQLVKTDGDPETVDYYTVADGVSPTSYRVLTPETRAILEETLGVDERLTIGEAQGLGFHARLGEDAHFSDSDREWYDLTDEWRRLVLERRAVTDT